MRPSDASNARVERAARGEVLALLEHAVRRQVELAVHVPRHAALEVRRGVVRVQPRALEEADDDRGAGARVGERGEPRVARLERDVVLDRPERVPRQAQLGQHDQLLALALAARATGSPARARFASTSPSWTSNWTRASRICRGALDPLGVRAREPGGVARERLSRRPQVAHERAPTRGARA